MKQATNFPVQYQEHLLKSIEKKRQLSLKEFDKTDLNKNASIEDVNQWYNQLILKVKEKPPFNYVKCLEVNEQGNEIIKSVSYDYFDDGENICDAVIIVTIDVAFSIKKLPNFR